MKSDDIIEGAAEGEGVQVNSFGTPALWGCDSSIEPWQYNPEAALALLAEAGFVDDDNDPGTPLIATEDALYAEPGTPFAFHLLGTDNLGRDHLARLLYAGQVSMLIGFLSGALSLAIGVSLGILTGFYGGFVDDLVIWIITTLNSIPGLVLLIVISALFSPDPSALILVLVLLLWTTTTRLVRGETLSIRSREYIVSAQAVGASNIRIMLVHILPNVFSLTIITLAINIGAVILIESAVSFLGVGIQPPTATWGNMLSKSREFFKVGPHLVIFPGLLITVVVLCLYLIGDGLRDAFDPTSQN